ncbi:hypothetical protein V8C35DRAFT_331052 [Trichoderma chlorosporum]
MKTASTIILSLFATAGFAIPMEQAQQSNQAQMMAQMQMAANGLFDPPRRGNGNIIGDIFDTAACVLGGFVFGSQACNKRDPTVVTVDSHRNDNSSTSTTYQYSYTTDSNGDYHIEIVPGGNKSNCSYTIPKDDATVLATTINQLAAKCISK